MQKNPKKKNKNKNKTIKKTQKQCTQKILDFLSFSVNMHVILNN